MKRENNDKLEQLYRLHFDTVQIHAFGHVQDWDSAQEAAQETFRIACEKMDTLLASENQIGWLKQTAKYVCLNMLRCRQQQQMRLLSLDELTDDRQPSRFDTYSMDATERFRGSIDAEDIDLLNRIFVEHQTYQMVAKSLGISLWACYKRVQRLTKKLQENKENFLD